MNAKNSSRASAGPTSVDRIIELEASLWEMLDCYWNVGDGHRPPAFIRRAIKLCGYKYTPPKSKKGTKQ